MPRLTPEQLEALIHRTLRDLPDRSAPPTLEQRVHAALARREILPWWRRSYADWPLGVRTVFLVVSGIFAAVSIAGFVRLGTSASTLSLMDSLGSFLGPLRTFVDGVTGLGAHVLRGIPPGWLYSGLAFIAVMYAALIGLGFTAYRTLFNHR